MLGSVPSQIQKPDKNRIDQVQAALCWCGLNLDDVGNKLEVVSEQACSDPLCQICLESVGLMSGQSLEDQLLTLTWCRRTLCKRFVNEKAEA